MNLFWVILFSFVAYSFWLFGKSFLNGYYETEQWDSYAVSNLLLASACAAASAGSFAVVIRFSLYFVM